MNDPNQFREPVGYICPQCKEILYGMYTPYCGQCGKPMPSELKLQAVGLTIYPFRYGRGIRDVDEIAEFLLLTGETKFWLEEYHGSWRTTKIHIEKIAEQADDHHLVLTGTLRLELPIDDGWRGVMHIERDENKFHLYDEDNNVWIVADGSVGIYPVAPG